MDRYTRDGVGRREHCVTVRGVALVVECDEVGPRLMVMGEMTRTKSGMLITAIDWKQLKLSEYISK